MEKVKVAALQFPVKDGFEENLKQLKRLTNRLSREEPDILCLPEAWTHPLPSESYARLTEWGGKVLDNLINLAVELGVQLYGGGIYVDRDGPRVSCPVIAPDGLVIGWQDKLHLFRGEKGFFKAGDTLSTFEYKGVKVGVLICHDIVYPELARILTLKSVELILNPSRISREGIGPWHLYVSARCLENRVPIVAPNVWLDNSIPGRTIVVEPIGSKVVVVKKTVYRRRGGGALIVEIDLKSPKQSRTERLSNRRPELYRDLCSG